MKFDISVFDDYPEIMNKEQMFKACGISQRVKSEPVYFALRHSSAVSSSLRIRQYASFVFLAAKHRKTK